MFRNKKLVFAVVVFAGLCIAAGSALAGMAKKPIDLEEVDEADIDKEILRLGIIAELDAVSLYEQLAAKATDERIKKIMLHAAKEEKTHVGEFQALLLMVDKEQKEELVAGEKDLLEELAEKD
ncbi:MAG: ferritin family protein [Candidatus Omnitrophota bacterium]